MLRSKRRIGNPHFKRGARHGIARPPEAAKIRANFVAADDSRTESGHDIFH